MSGVPVNNIVKRSISLSPRVNAWAEELAEKRGFGNNFSGFLADLVRRAQEQDSANSVARLADEIVSDAAARVAGQSATKSTPAPVSYGSKKKAPRRSKVKPVSKP